MPSYRAQNVVLRPCHTETKRYFESYASSAILKSSKACLCNFFAVIVQLQDTGTLSFSSFLKFALEDLVTGTHISHREELCSLYFKLCQTITKSNYCTDY